MYGAGYLSSPEVRRPAPPQNGSFTSKELPHPSRTYKKLNSLLHIYFIRSHRRTRAHNSPKHRTYADFIWKLVERQSNAGKLIRRNLVRE